MARWRGVCRAGARRLLPDLPKPIGTATPPGAADDAIPRTRRSRPGRPTDARVAFTVWSYDADVLVVQASTMTPRAPPEWLPRSIQTLARLRRCRDLSRRPDRRRHRRPGRAAAGDGVRDRVRPDAAGRHLLRDHHRLPDLGARRLALPDRRARPAPSSSWSPASSRSYGIDGLFMCTLMAGVMLVIMGLTGTGSRGQVHPAAGDHRLHQRHRAGDRQHAAEGLPRPDDRRAGRVHRPRRRRLARNLGAVSRDSVLLGAATLVLLIVWSRYVKRVPAYIVALFAGTARGDRCSDSTSRRSDRASAAFPSGLPHFQVPDVPARS